MSGRPSLSPEGGRSPHTSIRAPREEIAEARAYREMTPEERQKFDAMMAGWHEKNPDADRARQASIRRANRMDQV